MEVRKLHTTGPTFSRLVTGVWRWHNLSQAAIDELIQTSVDNGITTFDHADIYGNYTCEALFGKSLGGSSLKRTNLQLITKCGIKLKSDNRPDVRTKHYDTTQEHIITSVERSLKNLQTDYLDLLLIHRPDPLMNPEEVAEAFRLLKQSGKVLHVGVSNFTPIQFEMLQAYVHEPLVTNQIELSLFRHQALFDGTVDMLMKHRVSPMAWSPLGGGKYFTPSDQPEGIEIQMEEFAAAYSCTVSQVLLAWLLAHPSGIFPILGSTNPKRITEGAKSLAVQMDRQDWFAILKLVTGKDVP